MKCLFEIPTYLMKKKKLPSLQLEDSDDIVDDGGKERVVDRFLRQYKTSAFTERITASGETALMVAIKEGHRPIIKNLVSLTPRESLNFKEDFGNTALHMAVECDNVEAAQLLVNKNPELLNIFDRRQSLPIHLAAHKGHREMTSYLFSVSMKDKIHSNLLKDADGEMLMFDLVTAGFYDLALQLFNHNQEVAFDLDFKRLLELLAYNPSVFRSGTHYSIWESFFYTCVPMVLIQRSHEEMMTKSPNSTLPRPHKDQAFQEILVIILWKVLQVVVPPMKRICNKKLMHYQAIELVKHLCKIVTGKITQPSRILVKPFLLGARNGIEEIVTAILESFPAVIGKKDRKKYSVFHYAVMYRHEKIFKIVLQHRKNNIDHSFAKHRNNILHLAGCRARQDRLDLGPGPILQMQRELQWFMEIEKLVSPQDRISLNSEGKTPLTIFNEEHADLASKEIKWVTGMASACSVAASLIATVAFAAAITVPGGNNSNGVPFFSRESFFLVFAVSDALALFTSITCVLYFLSIFTCRYGVKDFLYTLPNRVICGLICLILSVISLMIAFSSTLFLVFAKKNPLILIPIVAPACVPVISYTFMQLPPLLDMINSTYGPGLFSK
ncbi:Ankyrin repeat family protein [Abeliophyllum distichum]|uniref:Ankyrin repeat family protein n=1 Tax=Abeliophyllum distichum TaxID=126358 RepID=A0ABD1V9L2_9LAMI